MKTASNQTKQPKLKAIKTTKGLIDDIISGSYLQLDLNKNYFKT